MFLSKFDYYSLVIIFKKKNDKFTSLVNLSYIFLWTYHIFLVILSYLSWTSYFSWTFSKALWFIIFFLWTYHIFVVISSYVSWTCSQVYSLASLSDFSCDMFLEHVHWSYFSWTCHIIALLTYHIFLDYIMLLLLLLLVIVLFLFVLGFGVGGG